MSYLNKDINICNRVLYINPAETAKYLLNKFNLTFLNFQSHRKPPWMCKVNYFM